MNSAAEAFATEQDEELLSMPEMAELLDLPRGTAYLWAVTGKIPGRKIGGRYLFLRADVLAFKEARAANRTKAQAASARLTARGM